MRIDLENGGRILTGVTSVSFYHSSSASYSLIEPLGKPRQTSMLVQTMMEGLGQLGFQERTFPITIDFTRVSISVATREDSNLTLMFNNEGGRAFSLTLSRAEANELTLSLIALLWRDRSLAPILE